MTPQNLSLSLMTAAMKMTFYDFATDIPSSFWYSSFGVLGLSSIVYVAKNHSKKVQRIAAETQNNQRITNELQDRMLQLEVSSQDQFLQLHTGLNALTEGQGLNTPHKEVVKANWEDGPNGRLAGIERNTSARKTNETIKINKKSAVIISVG
ncbi:hypothetical protein L207DRAFT_636764 [Hyaloscypha variabilis F]|uniref:Uncharacterized protein n=1 Tax=Hyaloscypha variabilis (strain UAMH 11265 / GT02V1 / F) TaxID=1149755 RepID=A0A2J6REA9_HYAVF|nr:hypothetical protein L207DRAFT_636764 [Hyaloscypha variabilis F]